MLDKLIYAIKHPERIYLAFSKKGMFNWISDKKHLEITYQCNFGKKLDLNHPQTFSEKLQWLKLYDRNPEYTTMVDKYAVKQYVADRIGDEYVIPTIGVWDTVEDIDFDSLPEQFVLKCTHDSGGLAICRDKSQFDKDKAKNKIKTSLKRDYYYIGREWPYKNVSKKIIAEKYIEDAESSELRDYKFMCFNGKVRCSFVCSDRFSDRGLHVTFFDRDWNVMPFERQYPSVKEGLKKPENYERMIELAEILSKNIPFVRVDFYEVNGRIYFGELTFFPGSGMQRFSPEEWDLKMGEWIELPDKKFT